MPKTITIRLSDAVYAKICDLSRIQKTTCTGVVQSIVNSHLAEHAQSERLDALEGRLQALVAASSEDLKQHVSSRFEKLLRVLLESV